MFYLVQAGSSLQRVDPNGTVTTLTLPAGVTIDATVKGVFAVMGGFIFFTRASTVNLLIDPALFTVGSFGLGGPASAPTLTAGTETPGLTGVYKAKVGFGTKNAAGTLVNQSPLGPESLPITLADTDLVYGALPISLDPAVNVRIVYRTTAGGALFYKTLEIDENVSTTATDNSTDASLSLLEAPTELGNAPGTIPGTKMRLLTEWKGRLWGVSDTVGERDDARYTEIASFYEWSPQNSIPANPKGEDEFGIVGFVRRRDDMGLLKRDRILKLIGDNPDNFEVLVLHERIGCIAPDSIVVIRNRAYWLSHDGVYRWDDNGVVCISRDAVDPWFTTDTYFNRGRFENAFGGWNDLTNAYELSLAAVGSSVENRWVSFQIDANGGRGEWLGPHLTAAFTPTSRVLLRDDGGVLFPAIGASDGYLYLQNRTVASDIQGDTTVRAISSSFQTRYHSNGSPDVMHYWGRLALQSRIEAAATTLTVTPTVGGVGASAGAALSFDLTLGRQIGRRLGVGRLCSLTFSQAVVAKRFLLFGYEIKPVFEVGSR